MKLSYDGILTQYIRPGALAISLSIFFALMIIDGNFGEFVVKAAYLDIFQTLLTTMVIFYFSSRGIEKIAKTIVLPEEIKEMRRQDEPTEPIDSTDPKS